MAIKKYDISVVVPVYKEEANIKPFLERMEKVLSILNINYEILFCLDPSPDNTEKMIQNEIERNTNIKLIKFSRRFGQPAATMGGILLCKGEACIVIDVDLQDPPELIIDMYKKLSEGYEVVYAQRRSRQGETWIKRLIAHLGYRVINQLSDVEIPKNTGDFRIMTRRVIEELRHLNETHGFLRGLVAYVGFKQTAILYDRDARFSGKGNYNRLTGSLKIGLNGIISFSSRPLQLMSIAGIFFIGLSFLLGLWSIAAPGLSLTALFISFFSGVQLLALGLMGEYIGRIYDEVKKRPMYIVDEIIEHKEKSKHV